MFLSFSSGRKKPVATAKKGQALAHFALEELRR